MTDDQHAEGTPGSGGRWDPLPQGEYDDGATAFVKLPEGGIDALLAAHSPLAAPGHGYVPPQIAVTPAPADGTDPAAPGGWGVPGAPAQGAHWPDPNAVPQDGGADDRFTYRPEATQQWNFDEGRAGQAPPPAAGQDVTGQWSIPVAGGDIPDESGEFTTSSLVQQWGGTPPSTLPGGAAAPWATEEVGQAWSRPRPDSGNPGPYANGPADAGYPGGPGAGQADAAYGTHGDGRMPGAPAAGGATGGAFPAGGPGAGGQGAGAHGAGTHGAGGHDVGAHGVGADGVPTDGRPSGISAPGRMAGSASQAGRPGEGGPGAGAAEAAYGAAADGTHGDGRMPGTPAAGGATGGAYPVGGPGARGDMRSPGTPAAGGATGEAFPGGGPGVRGDVRSPGVSGPEGVAGGAFTAGRPGEGGHGAGAPEGAYRAAAGGASAPGAGHVDGRPAQDGRTAGASGPQAGSAGPLPPAVTGTGADTAQRHGVGAPSAQEAQLRAERGVQGPPSRPGSPAESGADSPQPAAGPAGAGEDTRGPVKAAEGPAGRPARPGPAEDTRPPSGAAEEPATDSGSAAPDGATAARGPEAGRPDAAAEDDPPSAPPQDEHPLASYVLRVNGADRPVTDAWIGESLLYVLRERLGLAGAKDGCSQGECGACNVQVDGRLVASCLVPGVTAAGSEVRTVEGLAVDGQPSDVQRALARCGAVQCGFCVPGMAMTLHDLLEGNPDPTELETRQALCGNLCRCTGYRGVLQAVKEVVTEREAHSAEAAEGPAEQETDEPRIPHQAGPGAGGIHPSAFDTPAPHDPYGQDGGQA
ncbi:2Fe-2S iron-sulfur cluster-binding protein [Streptomyces sp. NPDC088816]|uniref:2Fe-2S iron-sulfur cluster-binding protein n=1 Tax=Streptomyces sp. NPDC088816 TaxID=3365906 RepID=UPI00381FF368